MAAHTPRGRQAFLDDLEARTDFIEWLDRIERKLDSIIQAPVEKSYYTVAEFAAVVRRKDDTVRQWCREQRIRAEKRPCGRGATKDWKISNAELKRFQSDGLLPVPAQDEFWRRRLTC